MRKKSALLCLALGGLALLLAGCSEPKEPVTPSYKTGLESTETSNKKVGEVFKAQYRTYQRNEDSEIATMTDFGGAVPYDKHDIKSPLPKGYKHAQPYLKNLWMGYPFSYEYRNARGHTHALEDIMNIDRLDRYSEKAGLPSTCWNCKTTKMGEWVKEYGDKFWSMEFHDFRQKQDMKDHSIGCAYCHDPKDMKLRLMSVPLRDYLTRSGKDPDKLSRNEMRGYVCGQCHVEYYFQDAKYGAKAKPIFPWDKGFNAEDMYEYYQGHGSTTVKGFEDNFVDWTHAVSKVPMLKAQHPEFEMWVNGPHGAAGVACADCHMQYVRSEDDKKKISSHHWRSPLKSIETSCKQCHQDKTPEYLKERVLFTQKRVYEQLILAQDLSVRAHEAVRLANEFAGPKPPAYEDQMVKARQLVRKAQFFWDLCSAENSMGFHNPVKFLDTLAKSQEYSRQAADLASQACNFAIAKDLAGDIRQIVPPIQEHSRKLQQSPEHLKSHKWLSYLPLLPKAEQVWDGNKRLKDKPVEAPTAAPAAAPAAPAPAEKPAEKKS